MNCQVSGFDDETIVDFETDYDNILRHACKDLFFEAMNLI